MNLASTMDHLAYPSIIAVTGTVAMLATASTAIVGMDTAMDFSDKFTAFGPFAQLFVSTLVMCVGGIVWWARMTEKRLIAHRQRYDELLQELMNRTRESERAANEKDDVIKNLVDQLSGKNA